MKTAVRLVLGLGLMTFHAGAQEGDDPLPRLLRQVRERVARSVVSIRVSRVADPEGQGGSGSSSTHLDYYNRPEGACTGTIWSGDGLILTSAFNVSGEIRSITVVTHDGKSHEGRRVGMDPTRDIALIQIEAAGLPVLSRAKEEDLRPGMFTAIVGRAPDPEVPTLNFGILSAMDRFKKSCVQTDAELNYGNVGGPLVTMRGDLIGVTCQIKPRAVWGQSGGVGFACRVSEIEKAMPDLKANRSMAAGKEPWLGLSPVDGAEGIDGVPVGQVVPNGPAEEAGLEEGDILVALGGDPVKTWEDVVKIVSAKKIGDEIPVRVRRKHPKTGVESIQEMKIKVAESP